MNVVVPPYDRSITALGPSAVLAHGPEHATSDALSTRFGPVRLDPERQLRFRGGLPGFPSIEVFQLAPLPGVAGDLQLLQAVDAQTVGFITLRIPTDNSIISKSDTSSVAQMLEIDDQELVILALVTLSPSEFGVEAFLNLRAPLFIDARRKLGAQVVLGSATYPLRLPLRNAQATTPGTMPR